MPVRNLYRDIDALHELCAGVLRDPETRSSLAGLCASSRPSNRWCKRPGAARRPTPCFPAPFNVKSKLEIKRRLLGL